jgi:SHS2 domain-containing protein
MHQPGWEHFHHGADIGVRGFGSTKEAAFEQAAVALTAVITDPEKVNSVQEITVACEAPDDEMLLTDWLNQIIFEMATRKLLFGRFAVQVQNHQLRGSAWGEPVDIAKHDPAVEIKGATYTELRVFEDENGMWYAQCVVDV